MWNAATTTLATTTAAPDGVRPQAASFGILAALGGAHMINDMTQSLILAIYPILKGEFQLSYGQIGLITLTYQLTASLFQPLVGLYTDRRPVPWSLPFGMASEQVGYPCRAASVGHRERGGTAAYRAAEARKVRGRCLRLRRTRLARHSSSSGVIASTRSVRSLRFSSRRTPRVANDVIVGISHVHSPDDAD